VRSPLSGRSHWLTGLAAAAALAAGSARAQAPAYLVKDINITQAPREEPTDESSSRPNAFTALDGIVYFVAGDARSYGAPAIGDELWRSDGTTDGTRLVRDLRPGGESSNPTSLQTHGGRLYFLASDGTRFGLWRSDGTAAGTELVAAVGAAASGNRLTRLGDGWLLAVADSDPSAPSAMVLQRIGDDGSIRALARIPGSSSESPTPLLVHDGRAYFAGTDTAHGAELWRTDGSIAGTGPAVDLQPGAGSSNPTEIAVVDGRIAFSATTAATGREIWVLDEAGATAIDLTPGPDSSGAFLLTPFDGRLLFVTRGEYVDQRTVWRSDLTTAGTRVIADLDGGPITAFVPFGGALYFAAGAELWRTDGTDGGTEQIGDFTAPVEEWDVAPLRIADAGDALLLTVAHGVGVDLWRSDGSADGAILLRTFEDRARDWRGRTIDDGARGADGRYLFAADNGTGVEPWITDGSADGTLLLREIDPGSTDMFGDLPTQSSFADAGGTLMFYADDREGTRRYLWRSDGTADGTRRVADTPESFVDYYPLVGMGDAVYLRFSEPSTGGELWAVPAPDGPARRVTDLGPGQYSDAYIVGAVDGALVLSATDQASGTEPWTPAGDGLLRDIVPGPGSSTPYWATGDPVVATLGGYLYFFVSRQDGGGLQLWRSDGSPDGTSLVVTLNDRDDGFFDPLPRILAGRDRLAIAARNGTDRQVEVWVSDGTPDGTVSVHQAYARRDLTGAYEWWPRLLGFAGDTLLFARRDDAHGIELWRSDGTPTGTLLLDDLNPGPASSLPTGGVAVGDRLLFFADDGVHGREPWITDGADETHLVADLNPGAGASRTTFAPTPLALDGLALFAAADDVHGLELWQSDGSAAGTRLVADVATGPGSSSPLGLIVSGPRLFFTASDHVHGRELWAVELDALACAPSCVAPTPTPRRTPEPIWTSGPPRSTATATPTRTERPIESCRSGELSGCAVMEIGTLSASPGDEVEVPVRLVTGGLAIAGVQLDLVHAPGLEPLPETCRVIDATDKQTYAALPGDHHGAMRVLLLSTLNVDPLPDGTLFTCAYGLSADLAPGRHPIACERIGASSPQGDAIDGDAFRCLGGGIIVAAEPTPTVPPTATTDDGGSTAGSGSGDGCQVAPSPSGGALPLLLALPVLLWRSARRAHESFNAKLAKARPSSPSPWRPWRSWRFRRASLHRRHGSGCRIE